LFIQGDRQGYSYLQRNSEHVELERISKAKWIKEEPDFLNLIYLGKSPPSITLDEFIEIKDRIQSNPLELKKHLLSDPYLQRHFLEERTRLNYRYSQISSGQTRRRATS
jgi:hypothetical protein